MIRVTIWNENLHEQIQEEVRMIYPEGIHGCLKSFLETEGELCIKTATFDEPEHGLTEEVLANTDVLIYWSHMAQEEFSDAVAERIQQAVLGGMGLIALHSAHFSKMLKRILGTSMTLKWRHDDRERIFVTAPYHPIAKDVPESFELPLEEMYGEYFDIPKPDDVIFTGWFAGGEVFRSGCTFTRGLGKIFYFQPGHEQYPIYHNEYIQRIIKNAVYWCRPVAERKHTIQCEERKIPYENIGCKDCSEKLKMAVFYDHVREAAEQQQQSVESVLQAVKQLGIDGIEVDYGAYLGDLEIYTRIKNAGLQISSLYHFFDFAINKESGVQAGKKLVEDAARMDVKKIMVIPGFLTKEKAKMLHSVADSYEATARCLESMPETVAMKEAIAEITAFAKEENIVVTIEDFDGSESPIARRNQIRWFLEMIPGLKHTLDTGNYVYSDEDVEIAYEELKNYVAHVHCKDRGIEEEKRGIFQSKPRIRRGLKAVPVGSGYMPICKLMRSLKEAGYKDYFTMEHFGAPDQMQFIKESVKYMKAVWQQ